MAMLDWLLGGWRWYRKLRGGKWRELNCPDGFWCRDDDKQQTCCYCPRCRAELVSDPLAAYFEMGGVVHYICKCGIESEWLFDAPVPILLRGTEIR